MVERQVRYNVETSPVEQEFAPHRWTFMIINEPREIKRIRERIYEQLGPVLELRNLDKGLIKSSGGLHYDFLSFSTYRLKAENPEKIYNSKKFRRDRDLTERDEKGLASYLKPILEGRK